MRTRSAAITSQPTIELPRQFEVIDVDLEEPRHGELLVKMVASGLCRSDDHIASGSLDVPAYPYIGGHEGAGIVQQVGPNTSGYESGNHVVFAFMPSCGRCRWCASGMQNLCDLGATMRTGARFDDLTSFRVHLPDGRGVGQFCGIGTFSEYTTVSVNSVVKVPKDLPLDKLCLLGCGVGTGWGSAVNSANVRPGETVIVMGAGGVGMNAIQGALHAGATHVIAVDPVAFKREKALEFGATRAFENMVDASEYVNGITNGQGADSAIVTVGILKGEHVGEAFSAIRKAGTVVVTGIAESSEVSLPVSPLELTLYQKRIQGSLFGQMSPSWDILKQVQMYRDGKLKLDELVTRTYSVDDVAQGFEDMHAGLNIRGVVVFD